MMPTTTNKMSIATAAIDNGCEFEGALIFETSAMKYMEKVMQLSKMVVTAIIEIIAVLRHPLDLVWTLDMLAVEDNLSCGIRVCSNWTCSCKAA